MNDDEIRQASIKMLHETIEMVERGELVSVAVAGVSPDAQTTCFYTTVNQACTIGAVRILEARLLDDTAFTAQAEDGHGE